MLDETECFESLLNSLRKQLGNLTGKDKEELTEVIKMISQLQIRPPLDLLPVSKLYGKLTALLAEHGNIAKNCGNAISRLRCTMSLCKIAEALIRSRYPKTAANIQRSESLMRSTELIYKSSILALPKGFYKKMARCEDKVKHKKALMINELRKCVECAMFEL